MEANLKGRVAIVTGGSKGIGRAIALRMAASGADVAMLARDEATLEQARQVVARTATGRVLVARCDVTKAQDIASAYEQVTTALGRVDIVVNNAGTSRTGAFTSITDEVCQEDLDLKLFAAIRLTRLRGYAGTRNRQRARMRRSSPEWRRTSRSAALARRRSSQKWRASSRPISPAM